MKKKEMAGIIEERFSTLEKLRHKIVKAFDADDIHDFRVEVKKLRAFLRLIDLKKADDEPVIPNLLKSMYGYIGIVRNIHLFKHSLFKYTTAHQVEHPEAYLQMLQEEENHWKKEAYALMENNSLVDVKKKIRETLPGKLEKPHIKKFVANKLSDLQALLNGKVDDDTMHGIRKVLKDISYTWDYIKSHADMPKTISDIKKIKALTSILGDFMDKCTTLEFLQPPHIDKVQAEKEKLLLQNVQKEWLAEKPAIRKKFIRRLNSLKKHLDGMNHSND